MNPSVQVVRLQVAGSSVRESSGPPNSSPRWSEGRDTYLDLKTRVQNRLLAEMDPGMDITKTAEVRKTIQGLV